MKISSRLTAALALSMMLALGSCAQTKIKGIWKDPTYRGGRVQKIMVLAVADNPNGRRIFENQFVAEFGRRGVEAIPSHRLLPGEEKLEKDAILAAVEEAGIDAVVVTRMVGMDIKFTQGTGGVYAVPSPYYSSFYGYYSYSYVYVQAPPQYGAKETASLETNIYTVSGEKLVWTVLSKTFKKHSISDAIISITGTLIDQMIKDGLV